jgi:hypothetical protein
MTLSTHSQTSVNYRQRPTVELSSIPVETEAPKQVTGAKGTVCVVPGRFQEGPVGRPEPISTLSGRRRRGDSEEQAQSRPHGV